jgi:hypothetical protein
MMPCHFATKAIDHDAAGERIVAFALPGKHPKAPFWRPKKPPFATQTPRIGAGMQRFLKLDTIDDPNMLPAKSRLAFARDARTGRNCAVVWRRGKSVGIKFVG